MENTSRLLLLPWQKRKQLFTLFPYFFPVTNVKRMIHCMLPENNIKPEFYVKSVLCIRSYSGPFFPAFGLNTEISPHSVRMQENTDQNNSEYGHFLHSENVFS